MFKYYLENNLIKSKKAHIEHLEDLIISEGYAGFLKVKKILKNITEDFSNNMTVKVDGKPALIFGIDPENKQFFIGTKKALTKPAHSIEEIKQYYDSAELSNLLIGFFKVLKPIVKNGRYMGDAMFWPGLKTIDKNFIAFKPNTIEYKIDKDTVIGKQVSLSKYGIIVHTEFVGNKTLKQSPKRNLKNASKVIKSNANIWIGDVEFIPKKMFKLDFKKEIALLNKFNKNHFRIIESLQNEKYSPKLLKFVVDKSKKDELVINSPSESINEFKTFLLTQYKSQKHKDNIETVLDTNSLNELKVFFELFQQIVKIKNSIIDKLEEFNSLSSYIGGKKTLGEGFVTTCDGTICKLVNRNVFSKNNFLNYLQNVSENVSAHFIAEGGNIFDDLSRVNKEDVQFIFNSIKKIFSNMDIEVIGSGGKVPTSGDIDIVFNLTDFPQVKGKTLKENAADYIINKIKDKYLYEHSKGFNQVSIAFPYKAKDGQNKKAQVDLMYGAKDWAKFAMNTDESSFKSKFRNILLGGIVKHITLNVTKSKDGKNIEWSQKSIDFLNGLQSVVKSRENVKTGKILKNGKVIERKINANVEDFLKLLSEKTNKTVKRSNLSNFENLTKFVKTLDKSLQEKIINFFAGAISKDNPLDQEALEYLKKNV